MSLLDPDCNNLYYLADHCEVAGVSKFEDQVEWLEPEEQRAWELGEVKVAVLRPACSLPETLKLLQQGWRVCELREEPECWIVRAD